MATKKPGIPKGTRDFAPTEMVQRNYIFDTIKNVFQQFGYLPVETPAMETLQTLTGKYGEEGDKLLFKILNSGDFTSKVSDELWAEKNHTKLAPAICEKGLRYDLTVPFARFVVQHRNEITFPFKRYQIQPVWRADKPQKGRYREFYQCDVDVIGSNSMFNEFELLQIIAQVFTSLNIAIEIKLNNRKVLSGIAEYIGEADKFTEITVAIDKLEKIGIEKVNVELKQRGISEDAIKKLQPILEFSGTNEEKIHTLKQLLKKSETGQKGIEEIQSVFTYIENVPVNSEVEIDLTLARGLDYYTGAIIEVKAKDMKIGSICGGGRYDDLTGVFGMPGVSGVGVSFGAERIFDVMQQLNLFPGASQAATKLFFVNFGEKEAAYCLPLLARVREAGINAEIYPDSVKMKKQMKYANDKNILFVALIGQNEMKNGIINLKNMMTGEQESVEFDEMIKRITAY